MKSPSAQDLFQPMPGLISCTGVTRSARITYTCVQLLSGLNIHVHMYTCTCTRTYMYIKIFNQDPLEMRTPEHLNYMYNRGGHPKHQCTLTSCWRTWHRTQTRTDKTMFTAHAVSRDCLRLIENKSDLSGYGHE